MEYIAKLRLSDRKYIAVMDKCMAVVTEDDKGQWQRVLILDGNSPADSEEVRKVIREYQEHTA